MISARRDSHSAAAAATVGVSGTVCAVSAETEQKDKRDYDEPDGGIVKKIAKAVHVIHPFIFMVSDLFSSGRTVPLFSTII